MRLILTILVSTASLIAAAQNSLNEKLYLQVSCGAGGVRSPEILDIRKMIFAKDYEGIKEKLVRGNRMERLLSTIAFQEITKWTTISFSDEEHLKFDEVRNSDQRYEVCYTCLGKYKGQVRDLFTNTPRNQSIKKLILDSLFL